MNKVADEYAVLEKKYGLPSFEELCREFFIPETEDEPLLAHIRRQMVDKCSVFVQFLEGIMHPDTSVSGMYESSVFDEQEMHKAVTAYKMLMSIERCSLEAALEHSEKADALFIREAYQEWVQVKKQLALIIVKTKQFWKRPSVKGELF